MTLTIKCSCGNESVINLKTNEEVLKIEGSDEEIDNSNDKFEILKNHDGCITTGAFECKKCGQYNYL